MNELLQQIFNLEDPIGRTIVYWIRIFFWVGVINYGLHFVRLGYEYFCLKFVQIKIKKGLNVISPGLLNNLCKSTITRTGIRLSSIYQRIRDLVNIKQNGGEIDHDVLGDIHAGTVSRKAGLSNYILGILIILGLIGTLWGLTTAVIEVQPLLKDIDDLDQLPQISNALQETLKGMGTAFKTTLAGLITSLGLGALGWLFSLSNSAFLTQFETVVATEIIPHFKQTPESLIEPSVNQLQVSVGEFKLATEDNVRKMQESIQQLTEKSWDAYLEQQYVIANELREIPEELRESLGGINEYQVLIKSTVESFEKMTENFMTEISKHQSTVDTIISNHQGTVNTLVKDFKELTTVSMSQVSEYQVALIEGLESAVPHLEAESKALKGTIRESQKSQAEFIDHLTDTLKKQLKSITDRQENMKEGLHEMVINISKVSGELQLGIKSTVESSKKMTENFITEFLKHQSTVDTMVNDFKELTTHSMSQVSKYQAALLEGLENVVFEFKAESAGLKTTIREAESSQAKFIDELVKNLTDTLTNTLEKQLQLTLQPVVKNQQDMVEGLRETVVDIREIAGELQIRSALERQNEVFGRIEMHLDGQRDLTDEQRKLIETLDNSVNRLQQTFSKAESDEQQRAENILQQLTQEFNTLGEKMDTLNHTMGKPGLYRWGSEIRRWFRGSRKEQ